MVIKFSNENFHSSVCTFVAPRALGKKKPFLKTRLFGKKSKKISLVITINFYSIIQNEHTSAAPRRPAADSTFATRLNSSSNPSLPRIFEHLTS
jgi:hypothetical protein